MIGTFEKVETSSDESEETGSSDEEIDYQKQTHFMNMTTLSDYETNRDTLYTKDILKKRIVIDSHNYFQPGDFNTSNFTVVFDFDTDAGSSLVTTNYDIYHNVIGFRLVRTTIRTPPYNINSTNNIIKYKKSGDDTVYSITINQGVYNMTNISEVFQKYHGSLFAATPTSDTLTVDKSKYSQYVEYSDPSITAGTYENSVFTPSNGTFSLTFIGETSTSSTSTNGKKSMIFEIKYNGSEEITFLWDYDNITRGTARLFGFLPTKQTTVNQMIYSDRTPDVSTHFVDLVIPEIPSIGCKRNSSGRDIIERIQLKAGHGEYLHYGVNVDESSSQHFFSPITLHRLNIQLYSVNNVLYDCNNSDVSYEFELTMVKNKRLLT
tara:strand:+ start:709 stop:1842 length:1134 start_codon:yes stop_codon:yes gene_type:complete